MGVTVYWAEGEGKRNPRKSEMIIWSATHEEVDTTDHRTRNKFMRIRKIGDLEDAPRQNIPRNMNVLFWNERGIGRPSFKPNFRMFLNQYHPSLVVLAKTWLGREKIVKVLHYVAMDPWYLVEPRGFVGGILILWNSSNIEFQVIVRDLKKSMAWWRYTLLNNPLFFPVFILALDFVIELFYAMS